MSYAKGWKFDSENKKGLIVLVTKKSNANSNLIFGMIAADPNEDKFLLSKNSFQIIVNQNTRSAEIPETINTPNVEIIFTRKKVRSGHYIIKSGYTSAQDSAACYGKKSVMFDIESGKVNLVVLPNAGVDRGNKNVNWSLNPNMSDEELLKLFQHHTKDHKKLTAPVRISNFKDVSFVPSRNKTMYPCGYTLSYEFATIVQ